MNCEQDLHISLIMSIERREWGNNFFNFIARKCFTTRQRNEWKNKWNNSSSFSISDCIKISWDDIPLCRTFSCYVVISLSWWWRKHRRQRAKIEISYITFFLIKFKRDWKVLTSSRTLESRHLHHHHHHHHGCYFLLHVE